MKGRTAQLRACAGGIQGTNPDSGDRALTDTHNKDVTARAKELSHRVAVGEDLEHWRFWHWLASMCEGRFERHTVSFF